MTLQEREVEDLLPQVLAGICFPKVGDTPEKRARDEAYTRKVINDYLAREPYLPLEIAA